GRALPPRRDEDAGRGRGHRPGRHAPAKRGVMALPFGLGAGSAAFLLAAILGAAVVRGFSGFGFSALVVAATGLVSDPLNAVAVVLFCEVVMTLQAARGIAGHIDWRRVGLLLAGAVIGLPLGVHWLIAIGLDASR